MACMLLTVVFIFFYFSIFFPLFSSLSSNHYIFISFFLFSYPLSFHPFLFVLPFFPVHFPSLICTPTFVFPHFSHTSPTISIYLTGTFSPIYFLFLPKRDVANLSLLYRYFHAKCSTELLYVVPSCKTFAPNTRLPTTTTTTTTNNFPYSLSCVYN